MSQLPLLELPQHTITPAPEPDLCDYDIVVVGLSGKDGVTALMEMAARCRAAGVFDRLWTVHADLGLMEAPGVHFEGRYYPSNRELVALQSTYFGVPASRHIETHRTVLDGTTWRDQTLIEYVAMKGMFPDAARRWCTSDLKSTKIKAALTPLVRHLRKQLDRPVRILNVLGLRADESTHRAERPTYQCTTSNQHRHVDEHLPCHHFSTAQVWRAIEDSGVPYHWWYDSAPGRGDRAGASRLSCSLCILGSKGDSILAVRRRPRLAALYHEVEQRTGHLFKLDLPMSRLLKLAAQPGGPDPGVVLDEQNPEFDALEARVRRHLDQPVKLKASTAHTTDPGCLACTGCG
ncbi:phosphoadenosine phosphosulfate reductase family protein [Amycolatopsis anabasis]|uniref:phosphoadenosine phosphosulfate reductase domain-containing protein n=1 Tax=Amycolatopsis anabasis TaxID=1840409 RepID=UPI00131B5C50|nr:phosphoadenosine phosphosulfate reductase family protein [Amycolatopsis anabasis]